MSNEPDEFHTDNELEEPYNAADEKQVTKRTRKVDRERLEELGYIRNIMSTVSGRKWICNLIALGDPLILPYSPHNTPEQTHVNIGAKMIPSKLMIDIREACPEEYVKMLVEAQNAKKSWKMPK